MAGEKLVQKALQAALEARAAKHVADPAERAANLAKWQEGTPAQISEPTWYHGTHRDFDQFKPGQSNATFVTQDPSFANLFAMKRQPLTDFDPATKQWKALREGSDLQPNIMPVHVRAQNPFDYNNPAHIKALRKELEPDFVHDPELKRFVNQASMGDWGAIESSPIQSALKALGHDSFFVKEDGTRNLAVYDPNRQFKSATGNNGLFDPEIPRIDENRGGEVEREAHAGGKKVVDKALEALRGNSRLTQIATTGPSYDKGLAHLAREGIEGKAIDYGAGRGHGLRSIGADTFEPYPQGWKPTYTDPSAIPDEAYRRLLNLNVLNVLDPAMRSEAVANMGRIVQPGGGGIISTRGKDVMQAKGVAGPEPMSLIIGEGDNARYQKGFTPKELREYVGDTLGPRFDVDPSDVGAASVLFRRNREEGGEVREAHADGERVRGNVSLDDVQFVSPDRYVAPTFDPRQIFEGNRRPMLPQDAGISGGGEAKTEGGELSQAVLTPGVNAGPLSAGPLLVGTNQIEQPIVGYRVGTKLPEGFSLNYSTSHPTNVPTKYSSDTLSLAKDILGMQVAAQLQSQGGKHGYGVNIGKGDDNGQTYLALQRPPMGGVSVMGGKEFRFADGGEVFQSNNKPVVDKEGNINWANSSGPESSSSDFFRADAELMRRQKAAEDARKAEEASRRTAGLPDGVTSYAPIDGGTTGGNPLLAAIRGQESSNDPNAQSKTSTAGGLYGFIDKTWANTLRRMNPELYGRMSDAELSALKKGPQSVALQQQAADYHLNNEINPTLQKAGIPTTPGNVYLGWFQGAQGAVKANTLPQDARVADVFPQSVGPNAAITFNGKPYAQWTLGDLRAWADAKMASRMKRQDGGQVIEREAHGAGEKVVGKALDRIRAYHGSPHKFDKFDLSKVGTGEGAQAFGHGAYLAEAEPVAKGYRNRLAGTGWLKEGSQEPFSAHSLENFGYNPEAVKHFMYAMDQAQGDPSQALSTLSTNVGFRRFGSPEYNSLRDARELVSQIMSDSGQPAKKVPAGHMYEVDIHSHPEKFLDWHYPLSNQSDFVKKSLGELGFGDSWTNNGRSGQNFYKSLIDRAGNEATLGVNSAANAANAADASKQLLETGIQGIRYPDQMSRSIADGTNNFVIFDPSIIDILRRYSHGGEVDQALRVVREHHADGEAVGPTSQQRFRQGLDELSRTMGAREDTFIPQIDPELASEAWAKSVQAYRTRNPNEPAFSPRLPSARENLREAIRGDNTTYGAQFRDKMANAIAGDPSGWEIGIADFVPGAGNLLQATDVAHQLHEGDYLGAGISTGLAATLPLVGKVVKPAVDYGRRAVNIAREAGPQIDAVIDRNLPRAAGIAGGAAIMSPSDAEAAAKSNVVRKALQTVRGTDLIAKDPLVSGVKLAERDLAGSDKTGMLPKDVEYKVTPKGDLVPWQKFNPEDIFNARGYVVPALGDRSRAGAMLHEINDVKLTDPTTLQGGGEFKRSLEDPNAIWASRKGATNSMFGRLEDQIKAQNISEDTPIFMSHTVMGYPSLDSTQMMAESILRQIEPTRGKIDPKAAETFDTFVRRQHPDWPGILNPAEAEKWLKTNEAGARTSSILQALDKASAQKGGLPNLGAARLAVMEPRLVSADQLSSGFAVSKLDPYKRAASTEHTTYTTPLLGEYKGGTEYQIPARLMFRDWFDKLSPTFTERATGKVKPTTPTMYQHSLMTQFPAQKADQEWLDSIMKYIEANPKKWGYRFGGSANE